MANYKPNSGSFKKGYDPRRQTAQTYKDGQQVRELCRLKTEEAVATVAELMRDESMPGNVRLNAANALLDRGWGKAVSAVAILEDKPEARKMSRQELDNAIANALSLPERPQETIEGEVVPLHSEEENVAGG